MWERLDPVNAWLSDGASLSTNGPKQNRRDLAVFALVQDWLDLAPTWFSHRASLSPKSPKQKKGT